ncbi:MAG: hypothetical protein ACR2IS_01720 [Nitrososphaeraceae archaeon]
MKSDICRHRNVKLELKTTWIKVYGCLVNLNDTPTLWNTLDPNWKAPLAGGTTNTNNEIPINYIMCIKKVLRGYR